MSQEKIIQINVLLELKDFLRANYWFYFQKLKLFVVMVFFAGFVYPLLYVSGVIGEPSKNPSQSNWGFLIPGGILIMLIVSIYFQSKKYLASNKMMQEKIQYTFSDAGIQSIAPSSSGSHKWETLREAVETRHNFLLFIADRQMYVFPK